MKSKRVRLAAIPFMVMATSAVSQIPSPFSGVNEPKSEREMAIDWVRKHSLPLSNLSRISRAIGRPKVIGLGEATHGTSEFYKIRKEIIFNLIKSGKIDSIYLEASLPDCVNLDAFIQGKPGNVHQLVRDLKFWILRNEEMVDLMQSLQKFNEINVTKVHLYGVDIQNQNSAWIHLETILKELNNSNILINHDLIAPLINTEIHQYDKYDELKKNALRKQLETMKYQIVQRRSADSTRSRRDLWNWALLETNVLLQAESKMRQPGANAFVRDQAMADNLLFIFNNFSKHCVFIAHNLHVGRGSIGGAPSVGKLLQEKLGKDYFPIGLLFNQGTFLALTPNFNAPVQFNPTSSTPSLIPPTPVTVGEAIAGSVEEIFSKSYQAPFFIDLTFKSYNVVPSWLKQLRPSRSIGAFFNPRSASAGFIPLYLTSQYSGVIFINESTPTKIYSK